MYRCWIWTTILILPFPGSGPAAQTWASFWRSAGPGAETVDRIAVSPDGAVCAAGTFDQDFSPGGDNFPSLGGKDLFFGCMEPSGAWRWVKSGGSILDDEINGLASDAEGNIILAGTYWFNGAFDGITLSAGSNPKGIFLLKFSPSGEALWGLSANGSALKGVGGVGTDPMGNIWLTGFFEGQLSIGDTLLAAAGQTDLFLAKFDPQGNLLWALREGLQGDTRAQAIAVDEEGMAVIGGYFNSQALIAGISHTANTSDRDVFIAKYNAAGQALWSRKAGGVHDDDITGLALDEQGQIYATGYLVGVMNLGEGISIQSATGNPDFYMLNYAQDGTPKRARAFAGTQSKLATSIASAGGKVFVSGYFQGNMSWDGFSLSSPGAFTGFFAGFNNQFEGVWAQAIPATQGLFPQMVALAPGGRLWAAGSFSGTGQFPVGVEHSEGVFDGFIMSTGDPVRVSSSEKPAGPLAFPNPATDLVNIPGIGPGETVTIFDATGRYCMGPFYSGPIEIGALSPGQYIAVVSSAEGLIAVPFVKLSP